MTENFSGFETMIFFFFCGLPLFMYLFMFAYFHLYMCTHTQVETALDVSYSP